VLGTVGEALREGRVVDVKAAASALLLPVHDGRSIDLRSQLGLPHPIVPSELDHSLVRAHHRDRVRVVSVVRVMRLTLVPTDGGRLHSGARAASGRCSAGTSPRWSTSGSSTRSLHSTHLGHAVRSVSAHAASNRADCVELSLPLSSSRANHHSSPLTPLAAVLLEAKESLPLDRLRSNALPSRTAVPLCILQACSVLIGSSLLVQPHTGDLLRAAVSVSEVVSAFRASSHDDDLSAVRKLPRRLHATLAELEGNHRLSVIGEIVRTDTNSHTNQTRNPHCSR
jgi:hypothetical protein